MATDLSEHALSNMEALEKAEEFKTDHLAGFEEFENTDFGKLCYADGYKDGYLHGMEVMRTLLESEGS